MDKETKAALDESIDDWERRGRGETHDNIGVFLSVKICPLCALGKQRYNTIISQKIICDYCIIKERTGLDSCHGTPYQTSNYKGYPLYQQDVAEFLKSLLPKEETNMKIVMFDNKDSDVVNIESVSGDKVYGYIFDESKPRLLRMVDKKYKWVEMNDSTQSILVCYNKTETLAEAIKEVNSQFPNATIYQFNTMNEFYKWAIKE